MANESPKGTAPLLDETFLPGDIKYENPKGNVHIYFPIATAIVLSILIWLFVSTKRHEMGMGLGLTISRMIIDYHGGKLNRIVGRQRGCIIPVPNANCAYRQRRYSRGRNYCHLDGRSFCAAQARDQSLASRDLLAAADEVIE